MAHESTLKYSLTSKDFADKKAKERKINLLLLIKHFLKSEGYLESYNQFVSEAKLPKDYEICDNMELNNILQDYETFYYIRFQKYPKISKKVQNSTESIDKCNSTKSTTVKKRPPPLKETKGEPMQDSADISISGMSVLPLSFEFSPLDCNSCFEEKLLKPLGSFEGYSDEWKTLAHVIARDIVEHNLHVKWDDVVGLDEAKALLKEAIVYPMKYPQLYKGNVTPWKGLLLYGPSGTGKTLLAKAVASECQTTFFNISASSIVSKWRGDSEKLVRVMFDLARLQAPSTIFIDELDAIGSRRDSGHEHEASRRLKSELLVQLDGLCQSNENIFFLTSSNLPWDLDVAILRRLEKKILIGLPQREARQKLLQMYLPHVVINEPLLTSEVDYTLFAEKCEGYSGSDIKLLCKEVIMSAVRNVFSELETSNKSEKKLKQMKLNPISNSDFQHSLEKVKSPTSSLLERYIAWSKEFGSG